MTTVNSMDTARHIARHLLQRKLVACVNISSQVNSLYQWEGNIVEDSEYILLMKTDMQHLGELESKLLELHPYDVPEFIIIDIENGSTDYLDWITSVLT